MEIKNGDRLLSKGGDWHTVLKVDGPGYVQTVNGSWGVQHNGEEKSDSVIWIFTGYSLTKVSGDEVSKLYVNRLAAFTKENILEGMPAYPAGKWETGGQHSTETDQLIENVWHGAVDEMIRVMNSLSPEL